ncbi:DUF7667 family protein [Paenibacillus wynnii]|uniref:DUF7667 family protein n=1 Tax=Paenibacillus wynnii TaxID=268407 RepID=UPI002794E851|nr:hypothetical protein [Paenibacillus wynnii]MDQ0191849.1 hypothetical protein [Paenibacillus wynnii]
MLPVHERLAELYTLSRKRPLTQAEDAELQQCLQANAKYCWEMACLNNAALLAAAVNDTAWLQDTTALMTELRFTGRTAKRK